MESMSWADKVRKIVCIGRNYADHIKELGNARPKQPMFFLKPSTALLLPNQGPILRPRGVELHYELELALVVAQRIHNKASLTPEEAASAISGYVLALDLTARNVQQEAKEKGLPWSVAKGFDTFCPVSEFVPREKLPDPHAGHLKLLINGEVRQDDDTDKMIFRVPEILAAISQVMTLEPGDLILTGTPKGVGAISPGDQLHGELSTKSGEKLVDLDVAVDERPGPWEFKAT